MKKKITFYCDFCDFKGGRKAVEEHELTCPGNVVLQQRINAIKDLKENIRFRASSLQELKVLLEQYAVHLESPHEVTFENAVAKDVDCGYISPIGVTDGYKENKRFDAIKGYVHFKRPADIVKLSASDIFSYYNKIDGFYIGSGGWYTQNIVRYEFTVFFDDFPLLKAKREVHKQALVDRENRNNTIRANTTAINSLTQQKTTSDDVFIELTTKSNFLTRESDRIRSELAETQNKVRLRKDELTIFCKDENPILADASNKHELDVHNAWKDINGN